MNTLVRPRTALGREVRKLRLKRGWTQRELETRAGLGSNYVSRLESGRRGGTPRWDTLLELERVLGCERGALASLAEQDRRKG